MIYLQPVPSSRRWPARRKDRRSERRALTHRTLAQLALRHRLAFVAMADAEQAVELHWPATRWDTSPRRQHLRALATAEMLLQIRLYPYCTSCDLHTRYPSAIARQGLAVLIAAGLVRRGQRGRWRTLVAVEEVYL